MNVKKFEDYITELKSSTYIDAVNKLNRFGHTTRANNLKKHATTACLRELDEMSKSLSEVSLIPTPFRLRLDKLVDSHREIDTKFGIKSPRVNIRTDSVLQEVPIDFYLSDFDIDIDYNMLSNCVISIKISPVFKYYCLLNPIRVSHKEMTSPFSIHINGDWSYYDEQGDVVDMINSDNLGSIFNDNLDVSINTNLTIKGLVLFDNRASAKIFSDYFINSLDSGLIFKKIKLSLKDNFDEYITPIELIQKYVPSHITHNMFYNTEK